MKNKKFRLKEYIPVWALCLLALAAVSLIVELISKKSPALCDALYSTSGKVIRIALAKATGWFPFSLCETLIMFSPVLAAALVMIMVKTGAVSLKALSRLTCGILALLSLVYSCFVFGYGTGYYGTGMGERLGIERRDLSAEELYRTAGILVDRINADKDSVMYPEGTYSSMPYTYSEMNDKLNEAYSALCADYEIIYNFESNTKPVILSEPWTYTHISGMYSFFTGEANVNTNYPDFIIISSAAHEMAHQRGVTREDEANFVAFLVCSYSDDPYIRYSGYLDVFRDVRNRLASADKALYENIMSRLCPEAKDDIYAFAVMFDKYMDHTVAKVSDAVNNSYIESHGQPAGVQSYGLVVDLVAAYLLDGSR